MLSKIYKSLPADQIYAEMGIAEGGTLRSEIHKLTMPSKRLYDSIKRAVLYNILIELGTVVEIFRVIKTCLNKTCSKMKMSKYLSHMFIMQNYLTRENIFPTRLLQASLETCIATHNVIT